MKSVVVEVKNDHVVALSENGVFKTVKNQNYAVGEVLIMKENNSRKKSKKFIVSMASAVAIIVLGSVGAYAYYTPVSYVSLDVNPSVEYSVNRFDRVLKAKGVNEDGKQLIEDLNLNGKSINEAISQTVDTLIDDGYITDDGTGEIVIATSNDDPAKSEELASELKDTAAEIIAEQGKTANIEAMAVGKKRVDEAKDLGVTPGKLNLVEKLKKSSATPDEIDIQEWLNKPVKEIQAAIKKNTFEQKEQEKNKETEQEKNQGTTQNKEKNTNNNSEENANNDSKNNNDKSNMTNKQDQGSKNVSTDKPAVTTGESSQIHEKSATTSTGQSGSGPSVTAGGSGQQRKNQ